MSAIQNFKRLCVVGAQCIFTAPWCPTPTIRTVTRVQTRKVAFTHPLKPGESWLDYPKAGEIVESVPGLFFLRSDTLRYDFRAAVPLDGEPTAQP